MSLDQYLRVDRLGVASNNVKERLETRLYDYAWENEELRNLVAKSELDDDFGDDLVKFESYFMNESLLALTFDYFSVSSTLTDCWKLNIQLGSQKLNLNLQAEKLNDPYYELVSSYDQENLKRIALEIYDIHNNFFERYSFDVNKFRKDVPNLFYNEFNDGKKTMSLPVQVKNSGRTAQAFMMSQNEIYQKFFEARFTSSLLKH